MLRTCILLLAFITSFSYSQSDQALVDRFDRMYASQKFELALRTAEAIIDRYPDSAWWNFNAGAVCARLERPDQAITYLDRCAELKFSGIASFEQNTDLDPLREREDFQQIVERVRANAKARMDEFQREAKAHQPLVYEPPNLKDELVPLVIALHGTGMRGQDMYDAMLETAQQQGLLLVCPDGLRPSGQGFSWTYRDESEWFVKHLIERAVREHHADPDRVILVGFSQGANIALVIGQTEPKLFEAVIPICGHYEAQVAKGDQAPARFYLMTGSRDPWKRTYTDARRDFEQAGGEVELRLLTGRGHELPGGTSGTREFTKAIRWALKQEP